MTTFQRSFVNYLHRVYGVRSVSRVGNKLLVSAGGLSFTVYPYKAV